MVYLQVKKRESSRSGRTYVEMDLFGDGLRYLVLSYLIVYLYVN